MPIAVPTLSYKEAAQILDAVVKHASEDGGAPVAVAIVNAAACLICFAAMDGVMQASIRLSQAKAYSAAIGQRDTEHWATLPKNPVALDFDMRNWVDERFTGFTGGVVLRFSDSMAGGIGVSGRRGLMAPGDSVLQDTELARLGQQIFERLMV